MFIDGFVIWSSLKRKEIQKLYIKSLDEYILERNRKRYMKDAKENCFFSLPAGSYWKSGSKEINEVRLLFERFREV